jgi:hypothetical protein
VHRRQVAFLKEGRIDADAAVAHLIGEQIKGPSLDILLTRGQRVEPPIDGANATQPSYRRFANGFISGGKSARKCQARSKDFTTLSRSCRTLADAESGSKPQWTCTAFSGPALP